MPLLLRFNKKNKQYQLVTEKKGYQSPVWLDGEAIIHCWDATEVWEETTVEGVKVRLRTAFDNFLASIEIATEEKEASDGPQLSSDWVVKLKDARNQGTTTTFTDPLP